MAITRTRNHNVVVYRANMVSETEWDMEDPVDVSVFSAVFLLRDNKSTAAVVLAKSLTGRRWFLWVADVLV